MTFLDCGPPKYIYQFRHAVLRSWVNFGSDFLEIKKILTRGVNLSIGATTLRVCLFCFLRVPCSLVASFFLKGSPLIQKTSPNLNLGNPNFKAQKGPLTVPPTCLSRVEGPQSRDASDYGPTRYVNQFYHAISHNHVSMLVH